MPGDIFLTSPYLNSAGALGWTPPAAWNYPQPLGAFITPPLSLKPRTAAEERGLVPFPGGFLLHTGWPNPGLRSALKHYAPRWAHSEAPVWVHLLVSTPAETSEMVRLLEGLENVLGIELGLPPQASSAEKLELVRAAQGELPVAVCAGLDQISEDWLRALPEIGADCLTLTAPRGSLPKEPGGKLISGRLYGPALFPLMLQAVRALRPLGLPLIAGAGIFRPQDAQTLLSAGAWAVQLDAALWRP